MCGTCSGWRWSPLPPSRRSPPDAARPQASGPPARPGPGAGAGLTRRSPAPGQARASFPGGFGRGLSAAVSGVVVTGAVRAAPEQLDRVPDVDEARLPGHPLGPLLDRAAFDLHAAPAVPAGQMVMMAARAALAVQRLAVIVPDRVDAAFLAQHLQVAVDGGEPDVLTPAPQLGMDLLGAAEPGQVVQRRHQRRRLPRIANLGSPRPASLVRPGPACLSRGGGRGAVRLRGGHNRTLPGRF